MWSLSSSETIRNIARSVLRFDLSGMLISYVIIENLLSHARVIRIRLS